MKSSEIDFFSDKTVAMYHADDHEYMMEFKSRLELELGVKKIGLLERLARLSGHTAARDALQLAMLADNNKLRKKILDKTLPKYLA